MLRLFVTLLPFVNAASALLPKTFSHPGTVMNKTQVQALPQKIHSQPWKGGFDTVSNMIHTNYTAHAEAHLRFYWPTEKGYATNSGVWIYGDDAREAYLHALVYVATRDVKHAQKSIAVISAWATTNKDMKGRGGALISGWSQAAMAQANCLLDNLQL